MEVVRNAMADLIQMAKEQGCFRVLNDMRGATLKLSMVEVYNLPNLIAETASTAGLQVYKFKRALVISEDQVLLPFFENVSRNRLHKLRLFHSIESAEQWLFEP